MQIFKTTTENSVCAMHLDDKRLNKIITESAQLTSTAIWMNNCDVAETYTGKGLIYYPTHENHPLCKWCSTNDNNYVDVVCYGLALCDEYTYRFHKVHAVQKMLNFLLSIHITNKDKASEPPNCTKHFKHLSLYQAYKAELVFKWKRDKKAPTWTKRNLPDFYREYLSGNTRYINY